MKRYLIVGVVCFFLGFSISKTRVVNRVEYVKGNTIIDRVPTPYKVTEVKVVEVPKLYWITDTIFESAIRYDTVKMVDDFLLKREYELTVFDNTHGTFIARPTVQYNTLADFSYSYTPMIKQITREKRFEPFIAGGTSGIGGGAFINHFGIMMQANRSGGALNVLYKF